MNRRTFLSHLATTAGVAALAPSRLWSAERATGRPPCILLRNSWQTVNIGDIGHTPGALEVIWRYIPDARIILWPGDLGRGAKEMLVRSFPKLEIVDDLRTADDKPVAALDAAGRPATPKLAAAWRDADILIHGSGSGFGARTQLAAWHRATGKPYGVFGVSADPISGFGEGRDPAGGTLADLWARSAKLPATHLDAESRGIIDKASFMFTRDTLTREYLRRQGVKTPILEFGPDSQFGMTIRDDAKGDAYRKAHGLESGKFICIIPRSRYTPYYQIHKRPKDATDNVRDELNRKSEEADHAKVREMIISYVRKTGNRVMTCPEMTYQIDVAERAILPQLPEDVRKNVVWRDTYWLPDEAASIYAHAQAVVSLDCHSPIISIVNGTPAFYVRQPTDTCKGQMYRDLGLDDWFFEIEETSGAALWSRLDQVLQNPARARAYGAAAMERVHQAQKRMVDALKSAVA